MMKLIINLDQFLKEHDYLGEGNIATLSKIMQRFQECESTDTVIVDLKIMGNYDAIFVRTRITEDGVSLYRYNLSVS